MRLHNTQQVFSKMSVVRQQLRRSIHGQYCFTITKKKVKDKIIILKYYIISFNRMVRCTPVCFLSSLCHSSYWNCLFCIAVIIHNKQYAIMFIKY